MKTLIIALNSKYIHSAPAPWYLKASCNDRCGEIKVMEFTINENPESILSAIYAEKADVAAFSCYIWNIGHILQIAENLKKVQAHIITIFGGPEVSYDPLDLLQKHLFVDFVISGEGEMPFPQLLEYLCQRHMKLPYKVTIPTDEVANYISDSYACIYPTVDVITKEAESTDMLKKIAGITYRTEDAIESTPADLPLNLSDIPSPYSKEMLAAITDKIAYFESSRGCPFSCSYCLSSASEGVRFFPLERVKEELTTVIKAGVRQVKFVDRTFNCNKERAKDILRFISELQATAGNERTDASSVLTNFHFEAAADLFDDELISIMAEMPKGLIQLEIGIQSTNAETLAAVNRKTDITKAFRNIARIMEAGNIHLHLDLIAGLPYEGFQSFKESFNRGYGLKPHALQLGFLKLLKGSPVRAASSQHAYVFREYAPYEVLSNKYISYDELTLLKGVEEILDRYWNSGRFSFSLDYIINNYFDSAFDFYLGFYRFNLKMNKSIRIVSGRDLFPLLLEYAKSVEGMNITRFKECLKLDFLASDSSGYLPAGLDRITTDNFNDKCHEFLKDQNNLTTFLPAFMGLPARQIIKHVRFELISIDVNDKLNSGNGRSLPVYLFDYSAKDAVTGRYKFHIVGNF